MYCHVRYRYYYHRCLSVCLFLLVILTHVYLNFSFSHIFLLLFFLAAGSIVCQSLTLSLPLVTQKYLKTSSVFMCRTCLQVGFPMVRFTSCNIAQMLLRWHHEFLITWYHGSRRKKKDYLALTVWAMCISI